MYDLRPCRRDGDGRLGPSLADLLAELELGPDDLPPAPWPGLCVAPVPTDPSCHFTVSTKHELFVERSETES